MYLVPGGVISDRHFLRTSLTEVERQFIERRLNESNRSCRYWSASLFRSNARVRTSRHEQQRSAALPILSQSRLKHSARSADCHSSTSRHQNNGCQCEQSRGRPINVHGASLQLKRAHYSWRCLPLVNYFTQCASHPRAGGPPA
jgi:hypothetical protein